MCFGNKGGGLFSGGGLGGILGSIGGGLLDFAFPEIGIPLSIATGLGGLAGGTIGGLASGEKFPQALEGGAISGALSGALAGIGELATTGDFLAAPGGTGVAGLLGDAGDTGASAVGTADPSAAIGGDTPGATPSISAAPGAIDASPLSPITPNATPIAPTPGAVAPLPGTTAAAPSGPPAQGAVGTSVDTLTGASPGATDVMTASGDQFGGGGFGGGVAGEGGGVASSISSKVLDFIKANPMALLSGGGLLATLMMGNSTPGLGTIKNQAAGLDLTGQQNIHALDTGQLPPGAQASLDQATRAAEATIRSNMGTMGITGGTMEGQAIAGAEENAAAQKFNMLKDVTQLGLSEVGAADTLYQKIMDTEIAQDKSTQDAIARFAAALAGGGIKTGATA